ncbi:MAG: phosphoribosylaminoimidazolesuccinocarboxamide synthase [Actinomycetota bacterium]
MREPAYQVDLPHIYSGKVRDIYDAGEDRLLMVTSDRLSAFDVVMNEPVRHKGRVLTAISAFWFDELSDIVDGHLISTDVNAVAAAAAVDDLAGRIMLTHRADMLPVECIVRGHITGSAWKEYEAVGTMHGASMPAGLRHAGRLPEPVFTPSTKAADGLHDKNISFDRAVELVGGPLAEQLRSVSLELYTRGAALAADRGIVIADTKFEFGLRDGTLVLGDEVLTPDSSRFWPAESWEPGTTPPSFDKQPVRDHLETLDWPKTYPPPTLPATVTQATTDRYTEAYERITGLPFSDWPGVTDR